MFYCLIFVYNRRCRLYREFHRRLRRVFEQRLYQTDFSDKMSADWQIILFNDTPSVLFWQKMGIKREFLLAIFLRVNCFCSQTAARGDSSKRSEEQASAWRSCGLPTCCASRKQLTKKLIPNEDTNKDYRLFRESGPDPVQRQKSRSAPSADLPNRRKAD